MLWFLVEQETREWSVIISYYTTTSRGGEGEKKSLVTRML